MDRYAYNLGSNLALAVAGFKMAAAERMDQVVVLAAGRVVERGSHRELLDAGGPFARMAKRQALEAELSTL